MFEGIVSNAMAGGVISAYAVTTNLTIDSCTFADIMLLNVFTDGGYIYVAENPGEIHITNSVFSNAVVFVKSFFRAYFCFYFSFIYLFFIYLFIFFNRQRTVELFTWVLMGI
jgi:hypothetical protein